MSLQRYAVQVKFDLNVVVEQDEPAIVNEPEIAGFLVHDLLKRYAPLASEEGLVLQWDRAPGQVPAVRITVVSRGVDEIAMQQILPGESPVTTTLSEEEIEVLMERMALEDDDDAVSYVPDDDPEDSRDMEALIDEHMAMEIAEGPFDEPEDE